MSSIKIVFAVLFTILAVCKSCYYDNEEALYPDPGTTCDTTNVTFSVTISTILANNCLSCHSNTAAITSGNGIRLENYTDFKARATAVAGAVKHEGPYSPMPKNGGRLKACFITQIDIWIREGMLNN